MWDGTSWSHVTVFAVDDEPTSGSTNLVDSDGICQFVLEHGFNDDIDIVDVTGSDYFKDRIVYAMRKNIGTSEDPEYEKIAEFTIPIASATAPTVTIAQGASVNAVATSDCKPCSRTFVSETPLTITVA